MTAAARPAPESGPDSGADPGTDPQSPYESLRARIVIALVAGGLSLLLGLFTDHGLLSGLDGYPWGLRAADVACGAAGYAALWWWRRRWPLAFAGDIAVISVFSTLSGGLPFVAAFTVAVHRHWPTALLTSALLTLAAWPSLILYRNSDIGVLMLVVAIVMFALTGWGMFIRARSQLLATLPGGAERAEADQQQHAEQARRAERTRIAREMHDVLAHRISLLACTPAGWSCGRRPPGDQVRETAALLRSTAHRALEELRGVIGVLRDDGEDAPAHPQPRLRDIARLVQDTQRTV